MIKPVARKLLFLTSLTLQAATAIPGWCNTPAAFAAADSLAAKFDERQFIFIGSTHGDAKIEEFLSYLLSRHPLPASDRHRG